MTPLQALEQKLIAEFAERFGFLDNQIKSENDNHPMKHFLSSAITQAYRAGKEAERERVEGIIEKQIERHKRHTIPQCTHCAGIILALQEVLKELQR